MARLPVLWCALALLLAGNFFIWKAIRPVQVEWLNVPNPPPYSAVQRNFLGDSIFAYRSLALMIQNMGDMGGRVTPLRGYDFDALVQWFSLMSRLDSRSDYIPYVAAFYFGSVNGEGAQEKLRPLVAYLRDVGTSREGIKWRWLAHAIHLARFKLKDLDYAYDMAEDLAEIALDPATDLPHWARQMPAFVLKDLGEKEAAMALMLSILSSEGEELHPAEVNHTRDYICQQILTGEEAARLPLCQ